VRAAAHDLEVAVSKIPSRSKTRRISGKRSNGRKHRQRDDDSMPILARKPDADSVLAAPDDLGVVIPFYCLLLFDGPGSGAVTHFVVGPGALGAVTHFVVGPGA
jgi:hypothetical protein